MSHQPPTQQEPPPLPYQPAPLAYQTPLPKNLQSTAACPKCGHNYASPISFTWWGGLLGPKLLHHVKCAACGNAFNGKTGKSNATAITIYTVVALTLALIIGVAYALA